MQKYFYLLHCICDYQNLKYVKINSVNPLYLIFSKVNGNLKENNGNNHLTLLMKGKKKI